MARDNFIFYRSFFEGVDNIPEKKRVSALKAIFEFVFYDNNYDLDGRENEIVKKIKSDISKQPVSLFGELSPYHWNWKGGISKENLIIRNSTAYKVWRKQVFERDKYTCQKCFKIGGKLNAHHIKEFSKNKSLIFDVNNGITLCSTCHIATHRRGKNGKE